MNYLNYVYIKSEKLSMVLSYNLMDSHEVFEDPMAKNCTPNTKCFTEKSSILCTRGRLLSLGNTNV